MMTVDIMLMLMMMMIMFVRGKRRRQAGLAKPARVAQNRRLAPPRKIPPAMPRVESAKSQNIFRRTVVHKTKHLSSIKHFTESCTKLTSKQKLT